VSFQLYGADLFPRHLHNRVLDVLHSRSGRFGEEEEIKMLLLHDFSDVSPQPTRCTDYPIVAPVRSVINVADVGLVVVFKYCYNWRWRLYSGASFHVSRYVQR